MRNQGRCFALGFALVLTHQAIAQEGAPASDQEPTAEETLILEYINRFRADPAAAADRIAAAKPPRKPHPKMDWEMFKLELSELQPAQPLVFNSRLVLASRNHSRYMLRNEDYGHTEKKGLPGFTGERQP